MEIILLIILIPILCLITGLLILKAYNSGLKANYELRHDIKPTDGINIKDSIKYFADKKLDKEEAEQSKEYANIMSEYLNGKAEE